MDHDRTRFSFYHRKPLMEEDRLLEVELSSSAQIINR
jgi:hypothetical protein